MSLKGKRVTVVGLGIEGLALVRFLTAQGAQVTVSDGKPEAALHENLSRIAGLPVRLSLGSNRVEDCVTADAIFVSQGVPLDLDALQAARERGIPFSSVTRVFMELCLAPIVGITGSAGKSTTTTLVGEMFRAAGKRVFVGGNLGTMLLERLDEMTPDAWAVLEISHTQLELTNRSPHIAAVTNISPSHADRYPSLDDYIALKKRIYRYQSATDWLILNADDPVTRQMAHDSPARPVYFSIEREPEGNAAFVRDGMITVRFDDTEERVVPVDAIRLMGRHNLSNVAAACAIAGAAGLPPSAMERVAREFTGVAHRLEWVRRVDDVDYYDDSIATTPERTIAGLRSFSRPIVLLAGGKDKNLPLDHWAEEVTQRCTGAVCFGAAGPMLFDALDRAWRLPDRLFQVGTLEEAVPAARALARPGDVVLLSPACTSFDRYPNFEVRGEHFKQLVMDLGERSTG